MTQRVDETIGRQPDAERDEDHGADSDEHLGGLRIGLGRLVVSGPFGSAIFVRKARPAWTAVLSLAFLNIMPSWT